MCNSGALPLPAASSSICFPGCVLRRFSLLRFVFWFSRLRVAPVSPPDLSHSCTSRVGRHSVVLPRCVPRFCDFCKWPMRPDCCVSPVASPRRRLPGFSTPIVLSFRSRPRRFGVTASSDFAASFCAPGFCFAIFRNRSIPRACARSRLLLLRSFLDPAFSGVLRFRRSIVSRRLFFRCRL